MTGIGKSFLTMRDNGIKRTVRDMCAGIPGVSDLVLCGIRGIRNTLWNYRYREIVVILEC